MSSGVLHYLLLHRLLTRLKKHYLNPCDLSEVQQSTAFLFLVCWMARRSGHVFKHLCPSHFLSLSLAHTHSHSVIQTTPGTDKGSFMFGGLSWGQWALVLRASFTGGNGVTEEIKRNHIDPGVAELRMFLLAHNSFPDSFLVAWYPAHSIHTCLLCKKMDNNLPFELSAARYINKALGFCVKLSFCLRLMSENVCFLLDPSLITSFFCISLYPGDFCLLVLLL